MEAWESWQRQTRDGAVESEQRLALAAPVVPFSEAGAEKLGRTYWREVERFTRGVVRVRERGGDVELRLFGKGPTLLRFGAPDCAATPECARCSYPIVGGWLAREPRGEISFAQLGGSRPAVRSTIQGFMPTLAARAGSPDWTGTLYTHFQSRIHVAISRRYFVRLLAEASA